MQPAAVAPHHARPGSGVRSAAEEGPLRGPSAQAGSVSREYVSPALPGEFCRGVECRARAVEEWRLEGEAFLAEVGPYLRRL